MKFTDLIVTIFKKESVAIVCWFILILLAAIGYVSLQRFDNANVWKYFLIAVFAMLPYSLLMQVLWREKHYKSMAFLILLPCFYMAMVFINYHQFMLTAYCGELYHGFLLTALLIALFLVFRKRIRGVCYVQCILEFIIYAVIGCIIIYALVTGDSFNNEAVVAMCQTNFEEAVYYFWHVMHGGWILAGLVIVLSLLLVGLLRVHAHEPSEPLNMNTSNKVIIGMALLLYVPLVLIGFKACMYSTNMPLLYNTLMAYNEYHKTIEAYNKILQKRHEIISNAMKEIKIADYQTPSGIVVLIIGESLNRNYMGCYDHAVDTTPFQTSCRGRKGFYFYDRAYACDVQTVEAVPMIVTGNHQYLSKEDAQQDIFQLSLIDLVKEFGYQTIWVSTQTMLSAQNSPISSIASQADISLFLKEQNKGKPNYDIQVVDALKTIQYKERVLVIVHLEGNHFPYGNKFPPEFKFPENVTDIYDKSVYYNDYVISNIYDIFQDKPLNAFIYVSDHSDAVSTGKGHDPRPEKFTQEMIEIPLWVYLNETNVSTEFTRTVEQSTERFITNDLVFNLMLDILKIPQFKNQSCFSPFASDYYLLSHEPLTLKGKLVINK